METTLHNEIEAWLAADIHGQLSEQERDALHQHLVECKACRQLHQEEKIMHKLLEEKLATEKADPTFEQRMLSGFRRRIPDNRGGSCEVSRECAPLARHANRRSRSCLARVSADGTRHHARRCERSFHQAGNTSSLPRRLQMSSIGKISRSDALKPGARRKVGGMNSFAQNRINARCAAVCDERRAPAEAQPEFREEQPAAPDEEQE